jgi:hypothetical protein
MFQALDCDDDVLMLNKDTFTVGRFKELLRGDFKNKLILQFQFNNSYSSVIDTLNNVSAGAVKCRLSDINWNSIQEGQILRIGSKGWQRGKIRVQITFVSSSNTIEVALEFCPDEPTEPESPLDDLRQLPEYKNGLSPV